MSQFVVGPFSGGGGGGGDVVGPGISVDNQIALWSGTSGAILKAATGTGIVSVTSGVYSISVPLQVTAGGVVQVRTPTAAGIIELINPASSGHINWMLAAQQNIDAGFEICPSTVADSTTFTTPVFVCYSNSVTQIGAVGNTSAQHQLNGKIATNASGTLTLLNGPAGTSGNPTGYLQITINGTQSYIPFWQ